MTASIKNNVKKIVITSSVAAISSGHPFDKLNFDESDFSVAENCTPYEKSKLLAEQEAWKLYE